MGNAYIINEKILVDAAITPVAVSKFIPNFKTTIEYIVITHSHFDHIAYLEQLARLTGAKICIHEADADGLSDERINMSMEVFGSHTPKLNPDILLKGGEIFEGYTIIHTPGHTPGGICLFNPETGDLFSGDTIFGDGSFGRFDFRGGSREELKDSLEKLAQLDVKAIYPGHGLPATEHGAGLIKAALAYMMSGFY